MCNCITDVEEKILKHLEEKNPNKKYSEITSFNGLGFQGKTWAFEKNQILLNFEMKFESTFIKVNGETSKPRKEIVNITQTYCSFCGQKLIED